MSNEEVVKCSYDFQCIYKIHVIGFIFEGADRVRERLEMLEGEVKGREEGEEGWAEGEKGAGGGRGEKKREGEKKVGCARFSGMEEGDRGGGGERPTPVHPLIFSMFRMRVRGF